MKVDLIDIGIGNTQSVKNWLAIAHCDVKYVTCVSQLSSDLIVLPGVGSAKPFMNKLRSTGFDIAIKKHVAGGGRVLGICLGFQVMFEKTEEGGSVECLGLLDGYVERLPDGQTHNTWAQFKFDFRGMGLAEHWRRKKLTRKINFNGRFFFNHEYGVVASSLNDVNLPISDELSKYSAAVLHKNVIGFQFHPEKSQRSGKEILNYIL